MAERVSHFSSDNRRPFESFGLTNLKNRRSFDGIEREGR